MWYGLQFGFNILAMRWHLPLTKE